MTVIETARLILRPLRAEDAPSVAELIGNWNVVKMLSRSPYPYALADAEDFIARRAEDDDITTRVFAIEIKDGPNHAVGAIGIHGERDEEGKAELGYWIGEPYWGKGYMKEAATAAMAHAFETMRLQELTAGHFEDNPASRKILLALSFTDCGTKQEDCLSRGKKVNCPQLSLTRENWRKIK